MITTLGRSTARMNGDQTQATMTSTIIRIIKIPWLTILMIKGDEEKTRAEDDMVNNYSLKVEN